tara:strand:- start:338 stop:706 length:369 start_codon:yes stop_codon:yes gene_type:complete
MSLEERREQRRQKDALFKHIETIRDEYEDEMFARNQMKRYDKSWHGGPYFQSVTSQVPAEFCEYSHHFDVTHDEHHTQLYSACNDNYLLQFNIWTRVYDFFYQCLVNGRTCGMFIGRNVWEK